MTMIMTNWYHHKKIPDCPYCVDKTQVRKHGFARSNIQRYRCTGCLKTFQSKYIYQTRPERQMVIC